MGTKLTAQEIIDSLSPDDLLKIGEILGYFPKYARHKAICFIKGLCNELKNWSYDDVINYGDMHKVLEIVSLINERKKIF
jgi:hypothetical protein